MSTGRYLLHGLRISSEVMLTSALSHVVDPPPTLVTGDHASATGHVDRDDGTDVAVELLDYAPVGDEPPPGDVILDHHVHGHRQYVAARAGERVHFRVPGYGDFVVTDGHTRIACTPDPRVAPGHLPTVLADRVLAFVLALSGHTVLRAGAIEVADGAIAVAGPSGVGTSTLTAWFCAAGARLVSDDVLRVDDDATCHRGGLEVRLRDPARPLAAGLAQAHDRVRRTVDGRRAVRPPATGSSRLQLCAVVIPRPSPDVRQLAIQRLDPVSGAAALARVPRTPGWRTSSPAQAMLATTTEVAAQVGVHIVDVPWGPPFDPDIPRRLADQLGVEPPTPSRPHQAEPATVEPTRPNAPPSAPIDLRARRAARRLGRISVSASSDASTSG